MELGEEEEEEEESGGGGSEGGPEETGAVEEDRCGAAQQPPSRALGRAGWGEAGPPLPGLLGVGSSAHCSPPFVQGPGDLYVKRRNRGPSFTQLRTVPGPAHLRAQVPALPQHQPTPGHACLALGSSLWLSTHPHRLLLPILWLD